MPNLLYTISYKLWWNLDQIIVHFYGVPKFEVNSKMTNILKIAPRLENAELEQKSRIEINSNRDPIAFTFFPNFKEM